MCWPTARHRRLTDHQSRPLDLRDGAAQFGGERAEPVAAAVAVAGFAGLLQAVGGGAETGGADSLRRTFEPVRGGCQAGKIGGAPRRIDRLLGFDGTVAELSQQIRDAVAVVAEPGSENIAVDRGAGARGRRSGRTVADREPALERWLPIG